MSVAPRQRIKPGKASLFGGIAVALAVFVLWLGVTHELGAGGAPMVIAGLIVASLVGAWIRIADL